MKCDRRLLSAYRDGDLRPAETARVEEHLAGCAKCRAVLAEYDRIGAGIRNLRWEQPPASLRYRVFSQLPSRAPAVPAYSPGPGRARGGWSVATLWKPLVEVSTLAVVTVALILVFTTFFRGMDDARQVFASAAGPFDQQTEVPPSTNIEVQFNRDVDKASAEAAVRIEPRVDAELTWQGNKLVILPKAGLEANTAYTVTVESTVKDTKGNTMKSPLVTSFTTGSVGRPAWLTDRIGFLRRGDLWTMNAEGGDQQRLTEGESVRAQAWSADGRWVAYLTQADGGNTLKLADTQGKNDRTLARNVTFFRWSGPGKYLVYIVEGPSGAKQTEIAVYDVASGTTSRTAVSGAVDSCDLTPDGRRLVFARQGDGAGIWVTDLAGKDPQRLAAGGRAPVWSPDAKSVAFVSAADGGPTPLTDDRAVGIAVVGTSGESVRQLNGAGDNPRWSPDGRWLLFTRMELGGVGLWVVDPSGSGERRLADGISGVWSADGRVIVFEEARGGATSTGAQTVGVVSIEDGKPQSLVADATAPAWIRNGAVVLGPQPTERPSPSASPVPRTPTTAPPTAVATPKPANTPSPLPAGVPVRWALGDGPAPGTILVGTDTARLLRSKDGGLSWQPVGSGLPADTLAGPEPVPDGESAGVLFLAGRRSVYRSADGGETWVAIGKSLPFGPEGKGDGADAVALAVNPGAPSALYVALSDGRLYRTDDLGATWRKLGSLPDGKAVTALAADRRKGLVYAGAESGLWTSADGGMTWSTVKTSAPVGAVLSLAVDPATGTVYAGTQGRGAFRSGEPVWQQSEGIASTATVSRFAVGGDAVCAVVNRSETKDGTTELFCRAGESTTSAPLPAGVGGSAVSSLVMTRDGKTVYLATRRGLFGSKDRGRTWQELAIEVAPVTSPTATVSVEITGTVTAVSSAAQTIDVRTPDGATWRVSLGVLERDLAISFPNGAPGALDDIREGQQVSVSGVPGPSLRTLLAKSVRILGVPASTPTPAPPPPTKPAEPPLPTPTGPSATPSPTGTVGASPTRTPSVVRPRTDPPAEGPGSPPSGLPTAEPTPFSRP